MTAKQIVKRKAREPGDILRYLTNYHTPPKLRPGEILCHNQVAHLAESGPGVNGFRYFVCDGRPGMAGSRARAAGGPISANTTPHPITSPTNASAPRRREPLTMWWPRALAVPAGHKRVGRDMIAQRD